MLEGLEQLRTDASKYVDARMWSLPDTELAGCLEALHQLEQTIATIRSHAVREIDARGIPATSGFRTTAGWLRDRLLVDLPTAARMVELATLLDARPNVDRAVGAGEISVRHAEVIAESLDALPDGVDEAIRTEAEQRLLEYAGRFEPGKLRRLGARILDNVAPDVAEEAERAALERAEKRAYRRRGLTMSVPVDGSVKLTGYLTVEDAALVNAAFDPLCVPRPDDDRSPAQRRADALVDICQLALRTGQLPDSGGEAAHLTVTVPLTTLTGSFSANGSPPAGSPPAGSPAADNPPPGPAARGVLDTGERVGAATARRLACDAQILPVVLGGAGQPLDVGRARRLFTGPIRRALAVRDQGCAFPDCDRPARCTVALADYLGQPVTAVLAREVDRVLVAGTYQPRAFFVHLLGFTTPTAARIGPARGDL